MWTLYPALVGFALQFHGKRMGKSDEINTGREMVRWSMVAFAASFVFFELLIFGNFGGLAVWLLVGGALLVLLGKGKSGTYIPKRKYSTEAYPYTNGTGEKRKHDEQEIV
jgi:hypothetical protein